MPFCFMWFMYNVSFVSCCMKMKFHTIYPHILTLYLKKKTTLQALPPEFIAGGQLDMIR